MQVSFNGLYRIPGSSATQPKDAYGNNSGGKTIGETRSIKLNSFIEDIKPFRSQSGYSFYDNKTGDYYIAVSDKYNHDFENTALDYDIDYYYVGTKLVRNNAPAEIEIKALNDRIMGRARR